MGRVSVQGVYECGRTSVWGVYKYEKIKLRVLINEKGGHYRVFMNVRSIPEETVALRCQTITRCLHRWTDEKSALSISNSRWKLVLVPPEDKKEIITIKQRHHSANLA